MSLFKRLVVVLTVFLAIIFLGLSFEKASTPQEKPEQLTQIYWYYAPDIADKDVGTSAIISWALAVQEKIAVQEQTPSTTIRCYTSPAQQNFYRNLIKGDIDWVSTSTLKDIFENRLGFEIDGRLLNSNDLQHITELLFINPSCRTISISAKYLTEINEKKFLFDLNKYSENETIRLPFIYNQTGFALFDEMLLVSQSERLWRIIQAKFISRTQQYQDVLSGKIFYQLAQQDIAEKIISWAKENPMALFYIPAIKEHCFGKAFWTELFWEKRARYLAINAKELDNKFFHPIMLSPTFFELTKIFGSQADDVGAWIGLLGYASSCEGLSDVLITELRQRLYQLAPQTQKNIRTLYPTLYEHYLNIVTR